MRNSGKAIVAIILTYIVTRVGYWLFKFDPLHSYGILLDFAIWVVVYSLIYWLVGKFAKPDTRS